MIRRGFWITVGAICGITGYRRVARVTKRLLIGGVGVAKSERLYLSEEGNPSTPSRFPLLTSSRICLIGWYSSLK